MPTPTKSTILVTGGTGLLGNAIIRHLLDKDYRVRAFIRPGSARLPLAGLDVEPVEGQLSDRETLSTAIQGCTAVVHSAAMIHLGWQHLDASRATNVDGSRIIAECCAAQSARLLHVSTVDTLPTAAKPNQVIDEDSSGGLANVPCAYVVSKTEAEHVVRETAGLDYVIVHPGFMLGPYDWKPSSGRMMLEVAKLKLAIAPRGGCSACDVRDVATGAIAAMEQGTCGRNYILGGENISYQDLWKQMRAVASKSGPVFRLRASMRVIASGLDAGIRLLNLREGDVNGAALTMGSMWHYYSSQRAAQELGYRTRPLAETLNDAWRWLQDHHT